MRIRSVWPRARLALIVGAAQLVTARGAVYGQPDRVATDWRGYLLLTVAPLMAAVRQRWPVPALVATVVASCLYLLPGFAYGPGFLGAVVMLYLSVTTGHRRAAWLSALGLFVFVAVYSTWLAPVRETGWFHNAAVGAFVLVVMTASEIVRAQRERRAESLRVAEEEDRRRASEERLTMAQELHDVLAHNISLIHVQASTALHLMDGNPEQARTALTTIKQASKDVLGEMRSVLSVLRDDAPRSPTAGLDRLDELVERSGLGVTREVTGRVRPVPPGVERAVYRIIQECLTNAAKHAPGADVAVTMDYAPRELVVRVADGGSSAPGALADAGGGNGIPGMRERAAALGGTLAAGPAGRGFAVEARLPIPEEPT